MISALPRTVVALFLSVLSAASAVAQTIPDLSGLTLIEAQEEASNANLELVVAEQDSTERMGRVFDQIPTDGSSSADGRVAVYVSRGVEVPDLRGKSTAAAFEELLGRGLGWDTIAAPVSGFALDTVGRQVPEHPDRIDATQQVVFLTISEGTVSVPDIVGKSLDQAFAILREAGLDMQEDPDVKWKPGARDWSSNDFCGDMTTVKSKVIGSDPVKFAWALKGSVVRVTYTTKLTLFPGSAVACPENTDLH